MGKVRNFSRQNTTIWEINRNRRDKMMRETKNLYVFDPTSAITNRTVMDDRKLITTTSASNGRSYRHNGTKNRSKGGKQRKSRHGKVKNHHTSGREMWRSDTFKFPKQKKVGCLRKLHIVEENARFVLIAIILLIYLLSGAILFSALENEHETEEKAEYSELEHRVLRQFCPDLYKSFVANETATTTKSSAAPAASAVDNHMKKDNETTTEKNSSTLSVLLNRKQQQQQQHSAATNRRGQHYSTIPSQHWSIVDRTRWAWMTTNQTNNNHSFSSPPPPGPKSAAVVDMNDCYALLKLLDLRGNLSAAGLMNYRNKWDLPGAFYYSLTLVSTIGYGMTTPRTSWGKVVTIVYGFFGCASCILFFNLFLERIVTLLALILRYAHNFKERFKTRRAGESAARTILSIALNHDIMDNLSCSTAQAAESAPWRPSVYKVFICILVLTLLWMSLAATLYSSMEQWTLLESLYFCFVSFATIGLGDYVSSQGELGGGGGGQRAEVFYDIANFIFLSIGCSCIYSLFNVTSIVIRQFLNCTIRNMDFRCKKPKCCRKKKHRYLGLGIRPPVSSNSDSIDSDSGSTSEGRPVSLKEFLEQNKISMTVMQKKILIIDHGDGEDENGEGGGGRRGGGGNMEDERGHISADSVGPLAILNHKFGHD